MSSSKSGRSAERTVLDTNIVVAAALHPERIPGEVFALVISGRIENCTSEEILGEVQDTLHRIGADALFGIYVAHSTVIALPAYPAVCRDPDDDKFLACAIEAGAGFIISGDDDLLVLKQYRGIRILTPRAFLRRSQSISSR